MTRQHSLVAALWAAAILAAAALGTPTFLSLILFPSLAAVSLLARPDVCLRRSYTP